MWYGYKREDQFDKLEREFDVIVIGGGITGSGIFKEILELGYSCLLVEKNDFGSGTSSCSSKMVHGGLRYLKEGDISLTFESVKERELILSQAKHLVEPLIYIMPIYEEKKYIKSVLPLFLKIYDFFSIVANRGKGGIHFRTKGLTTEKLVDIIPFIRKTGLVGGVKFEDSITDDSRLVMSVLREGLAYGGVAINYCEVIHLLQGRDGRVRGVVVRDNISGKEFEVKARVVVAATGAWSKKITNMCGLVIKLRPLRGSHIVISKKKLKLDLCITGFHPRDGRPVFAFPWEGVVVIGTTDIDHTQDLSNIPTIDKLEFEYLLEWANFMFPRLNLSDKDVISTYSGVRPIVSAGKKLPSKEPRRHSIIDRDGLIVVVGGKLTTFRKIAQDVIGYCYKYLPPPKFNNGLNRIFSNILWYSQDSSLPEDVELKLIGRYGIDALNFFRELVSEEVDLLYENHIVGEIRWCVRHEGVVHLDDIMLRRTRLGLVVEQGGEKFFPLVGSIVREELGWDKNRWEYEKDRYIKMWTDNYYLPK